MNTSQLTAYYCSLLVQQYITKPKASATIANVVTGVVMPDSTIQMIAIGPGTPASGTFTLSYNGSSTGAIAASATTSQIQGSLRAISGLSQVLVTGSLASQNLLVAMVGVSEPSILTSSSALYDSSGNAIALGVGPLGPIITNQVANAFNINPTSQYLTLSAVPTSGSFNVVYNGGSSAYISYNATQDGVLGVFNALLGVSQVEITGNPSSEVIEADFVINSIPSILSIGTNTLMASGSPVTITITTNQAVGANLDIICKYAGVSRSGFGQYGAITLDDADFRKLIQLAIITNSAGSSLATIQALLNQFFPGQITVFDDANTAPMQMTYYLSTTAFSNNLLQLFITEGLLPVPMAVGVAVLAPPTVTELYGFCDYMTATPTMPNTVNTVGMNCATSYTLSNYNTTWAYLDYDESVIA